MKRDIERMAAKQYDLLVIGGGINGAAVARDAALRGIATALVEKEDFGYGTTARSTRLIHGGLRYLELFDFALVREGLVERERLLRLAPHLVRPLPFVLPIYAGDRRGPFTFEVGMILYDLLSRGGSLPKHRRLSKGQALAAEPGLSPNGLRGAMLYYDAQLDLPERLTVLNARDADAAGADVANYAKVVGLKKVSGEHDRTTWEATVQDRLSGKTLTVDARTVVNAGGPWADEIVGSLLPSTKPHLRLTKGIHLVVPSFTEHAIVLFAEQDDRLFFVIPWMGHSLVGTTDTDVGEDLDSLRATEGEVAYLIEGTRRAFPKARMSPIHYTTAGVRPLARKRGAPASASAVSRMHEIVDHESDGAPGLFSVLGGKITSHRRVAEETVDRIEKSLGRSRTGKKSPTTETPYFGGRFGDASSLRAEIVHEYGERLSITDVEAERLLRLYGTAYGEVLEPAAKAPQLAERLVPEDPTSPRELEVVYAIEHEMARTTADVLLRRLPDGLSATQGRALAPRVAALLGEHLGWDSIRVEADLEAYRRTLQSMQPAGTAQDSVAHDGEAYAPEHGEERQADVG